jgi:hypothetical protein
MNATNRTLGTLLGLAAVATLSAATLAPAQDEPVGVVTRVDGTATLARLASPDAMPLKLRDPVFVADRITTGDQSLARLLLGGKALVTVRERSTLAITESAGASTVDVGLGTIAIAVVKERMKRGETVEIRTPNAVAAIRGTVVIADVVRATAQPHAFTTTITVLRGLIEFRGIDQLTRQAVGAPISVARLQSIRITGNGPARPVRTISSEQADGLASQYRISIKEPSALRGSAPSDLSASTVPAPGVPATTGGTAATAGTAGGAGTVSRGPASQVSAPIAAAAPSAGDVPGTSSTPDDRSGKGHRKGRK